MKLEHMSRADYDSLLAVNWSSLKHMAKSPAHYRHALLNARKDTAALKRGRCVHLAVYEPERFLVEVIRWDGGLRRGKEWEAFKAAHIGKEILTDDEHTQVLEMSAAIRGDAVAAKYVSKGRAEVTTTWEHRWPAMGGLPAHSMALKGRLDFIADVGAIVDLKTSKDAAPGAFGRAVVGYGYHAQAAFYSDGYAAATGQRLPFVFIAVEPEPPYGVICYRVTDNILEMGREHYVSLLERLAMCRETNSWPGYAEEELQLMLPAWAMPRNEEDDISDLGLTIGSDS